MHALPLPEPGVLKLSISRKEKQQVTYCFAHEILQHKTPPKGGKLRGLCEPLNSVASRVIPYGERRTAVKYT